jgi:hypothetical protein
MKRFLMWIVWNIPIGFLAPWVLGLALGRMPRKAEEGE